MNLDHMPITPSGYRVTETDITSRLMALAIATHNYNQKKGWLRGKRLEQATATVMNRTDFATNPARKDQLKDLLAKVRELAALSDKDSPEWTDGPPSRHPDI